MRNDLVSIIVPVYNMELYLDRCLQSLYQQRYSHFEVLMINDGSTDGSQKIMNHWVEKDERFKAFSQENGGLSAARNLGLKNVQGDFISFVDSDDWVTQDFLLKLMQCQEKWDADMVYCNLQKVNEHQKVIKKLPQSQKQEGFSLDPEDFTYFGELSWFACNKLFRAELFKEKQFPLGLHFEDIATIPTVSLRAKRIAFEPDYLYQYFERSGSITQSFNRKGLDMFEALDGVQQDYQKSEAKDDLENWKRFWILQGFYSFGAYLARVKDKSIRKEMKDELSKRMKNEGMTRSEILNYKRFGKNYFHSLSVPKRVYYFYLLYKTNIK